MKRYVYVLCLMVSFTGLNSCTKNNDPEPQPVVGKWELERVRISGLVAPYASENGDSQINKNVLSDVFTVKADNTVTGKLLSNGRINEYTGTWTFSNNELSIKDTQGSEDKYTLDTSLEPIKLVTPPAMASDSVENPTTRKIEVVRYNIQLVYEKK